MTLNAWPEPDWHKGEARPGLELFAVVPGNRRVVSVYPYMGVVYAVCSDGTAWMSQEDGDCTTMIRIAPTPSTE